MGSSAIGKSHLSDPPHTEGSGIRVDHGFSLLEIDHDWCYSIYTTDPNGTMVEWSVTTAEFNEADRERARQAIERDDLPHDDSKTATAVHRAGGRPLHKRT